MQFMITISGMSGADWRDLDGAREEIEALSHVLDSLNPGESITIKRVS